MRTSYATSSLESAAPVEQSTPAAAMSLCAVVPVMDETHSLRKTAEIVMKENGPYIGEILMVVCEKTTPEAMAVCREVEARYHGVARICRQKLPYLGGALREAFEQARGTHVALMASDLETDPYLLKDLIAKSLEGWDIVATTRWKGGGFHGYNHAKFAFNWCFQKMLQGLYLTRLSDLTFGYRLYRIQWVKGIDWRETRHPFLLECLLKPMRLGARVTEIDTTWRPRVEGESHQSFWRNFTYLGTVLRTRFMRKSEIATGDHK